MIDPMADEKCCSVCQTVKPLTDFHWADKRKGQRRPECRTCRNKVSATYYTEHRDRLIAVRRRWYETNKEAHIARIVARRDPVEIRSRRAKARSASSSSVVHYRNVLAEHGMICHICGTAIDSMAVLEFDHIIPLAHGGDHTADNIRPAHRRCNRAKGNRH
jgi:5-methylcytosine-specific restriction endonuclease McrA